MPAIALAQPDWSAIRPRYFDLFERMKDPDRIRADYAFDAVLAERGDAVPDLSLLYQLAEDDPRLRFDAIQLLGFSEHPSAIPTVLDALNDPEPTVRAEACRSLEDLRAVQAADALRYRLQDLDARVRTAAAETLEELGLR